MATRRTAGSKATSPRRPPATTPEEREQQLVMLAMDVAEKQLLNGTASAQVITHFAKLGSTREALEQERLRKENLILEAKREALASQKRVEELYAQAMDAFRTYSGESPSSEDDDYDD